MKWMHCRWEEDTEGVHADLRQRSLDWLSECFEAAHQAARQAIDFMCNFLGMKASSITTCMSVLHNLHWFPKPMAESSV